MHKDVLTTKKTIDSLANGSIFSFRLALWFTALLLASGFAHLTMLVILGTSWDGPLSLRKPALFGISGGMTTWSIAWLMTQLKPRKCDRLLANSVAIGLFIEVALITTQYWRGIASHFNHSTMINAAVEFTMLGLILAVSAAIFYLTLRTFRLRNVEPSMAIAIRGGMWLLTLSCGLGILTSIMGELSISLGKSYELWGKAGVLKFPHGVALHAIQILPIVAWMALNFRLPNPERLVQATLVSQCFFLVYAIWQTSQGLDRFEWNTFGSLLLVGAVSIGLFPALAFANGLLTYLTRKT